MIPIASPRIGAEEEEAVMRVLRSGRLAQGPVVAQFEEAVAQACGAKHAIAVGNGTCALDLGMRALGIGGGDEVITTPFTFVATANAILMQGATPVFVDIDEDTFNINPALIEARITKKTKAIAPVDLYGQPHDYDAVQRIAKKHGLAVVEDAAQALGASYGARAAGLLGDLGTFSFYATKNLTTAEGGMVVTDNDDAAHQCRILRNQGQDAARYEYVSLGYNCRMTEMQAALGVAQMKKLRSITGARVKNAQFYDTELAGISWLRTPIRGSNRSHVYHQYTLTLRDGVDRDAFLEHLKEKGVGFGVYYPKALYEYSYLAQFAAPCPVTQRLSRSVVSIPVHPRLSQEDRERVVEAIRSFR